MWRVTSGAIVLVAMHAMCAVTARAVLMLKSQLQQYLATVHEHHTGHTAMSSLPHVQCPV